MNNHDYKALLISTVSGIVAGIAVNILWAISTAPGPTPIDHPAAARWVLQAPAHSPAAPRLVPGIDLAMSPQRQA